MKKILSKNEKKDVLDILASEYPNASCALDYGSPFQLLIAVTLSAQTTDKRVNQVTVDLFRLCPTAKEMAVIEEEKLQDILKPLGMYRTKTKNVINLSRQLLEKYDGEVPDSQEKLMELPGVGRKTSNVVMSVAFGHQRIAVDTHVFRVSNRIGLVDENDVTKTEEALMKAIPENEWTNNHHRLIWHGRNICSARNPNCEECALRDICLKKGVTAKK